MANCPKCNTKMPFFKIGFVSNVKNWIVCESCDAYCVAEKAQLRNIGAVGGGVLASLGLFVFRDLRNGGYFWPIGLILIVLGFFGLIYLQNKNIRLELDEMPEHVKRSLEPVEIQSGPSPSKSDLVEYLKHQYRNYSKEKLTEIVSGDGYREDAVIAANQLLKEKYTD